MIQHLIQVNTKLQCMLENAEAILAVTLTGQILFYAITGDLSHAGMIGNSVLILMID